MAVSLRDLVAALGGPLVAEVTDAGNLDVRVSTTALVDADDLTMGLSVGARDADLYVLVGVPHGVVADWLTSGARRRADRSPNGPAALFVKDVSVDEDVVQTAIRRGITVVRIDRSARWERVYRLIGRLLEAPSAADGGAGADATDRDLFSLARTTAAATGGLVSIEDERSHVLAYSASGADEADELRRLSILGREGPAAYLAQLRAWGVFDRLRAGPTVVRVEARPDLGIAARWAIGIHRPGFLGSIWVQEGRGPIDPDTADVLVGAAAVAGRLIDRRLRSPGVYDDQVRALLGLTVDDPDVAELTTALDLPAAGTCAVAAFTPAPTIDTLALRAGALHPRATTTGYGGRAYVLVPAALAPRLLETWANGVLDHQRGEAAARSRAAIATAVAGYEQAAPARRELDRVLDVGGPDVARVSTFAAARTAVLVTEIVDLLAERPELRDPRMADVFAGDAAGLRLLEALRAYLAHPGDIRSAAAELHIHPNTLRYRLRRIEELTGHSTTDPRDRLLMDLQVRVHDRSATR